jgi:iron complex outermembrane receptor protein
MKMNLQPKAIKRNGLLIWMIPILFFISANGLAQGNHQIHGTITDASDNPLAGVSVGVKGTETFVLSDEKGYYQIQVKAGATLQFSYVGMEKKEIKVSNSQQLDVILRPSSNSLGEVVVVGYGAVKRSDLTGSISTLSTKELETRVATNPYLLLAAKVPGLSIFNNNGNPGGDISVNIRGFSSINGSNSPLILVDGVITTNLTGYAASDFASVSVLKDASATAIYGSRGANGVVIITTKRGKSGVPQIDISASTGLSNVLKQLKVLNGDEYRKALADYNLTSGDYGGNVDAFKAITQTALTQNYNAAVGGGTENGRYRISAGYLDQEGVIKTSDLKKMTANLTSNFRFL